MAKSDSLRHLIQNFPASPTSLSTAMDDIGAALGMAIGDGGGGDRRAIGDGGGCGRGRGRRDRRGRGRRERKSASGDAIGLEAMTRERIKGRETEAAAEEEAEEAAAEAVAVGGGVAGGVGGALVVAWRFCQKRGKGQGGRETWVLPCF